MDNIDVIIKNIRSDVKENKTEDYLSEKFKEFKKKYPKTFDMCISPSFEDKYMNYIITQRNDLGNMSQNEKDMEVGMKFAEDFVFPVTGKPDEKDLKTAANKVRT